MRTKSVVSIFIISTTALISTACERTPDWTNSVGQRLLRFQIKVDGDVRYTGVRSVNDRIPASEVWDVIGTVEFEEKNDSDIQTDAGEMMSRTVSGDIVVGFSHGSFGDQRTIEKLSLRSEDAGKSWSLTHSEAERLKLASRPER